MTDYNGDDIYCDLIISRKVPVEVIRETENVLAFNHTKPYWPVHIVVTCKKHVPSLLELDDQLGKELLAVIKEVALKLKEEQGACRILTNLGDYQDSKHLHFHISSGEPRN